MAIELAYINTKHPDFTEATYLHKTLTEGLDPDKRKMQVVKPEPATARQGVPDERVSGGSRVLRGKGYALEKVTLRCI